ncbi:MAG: hypothetical protein QM791_21240 [Ferruginibacter sp.]
MTDDKMIQDLTRIIQTVKRKFTDESDLLWTTYDTAKEMRDELDLYASQLEKNDLSCLYNLHIHFLVTSNFQEHSLMNGWSDEYLVIAGKFDNIYAKLKANSNV